LLGCSIAIIGYLSILSVRFIWAIVGFGILGLGLSVIVPELFRLAGKTKGVKASVAISIVSGVGFSGFLLGPVILGFISNTSSLIWSYVFMACLVLIALSLIILVIKRNYSS
jgi:MFS family permease